MPTPNKPENLIKQMPNAQEQTETVNLLNQVGQQCDQFLQNILDPKNTKKSLSDHISDHITLSNTLLTEAQEKSLNLIDIQPWLNYFTALKDSLENLSLQIEKNPKLPMTVWQEPFKQMIQNANERLNVELRIQEKSPNKKPEKTAPITDTLSQSSQDNLGSTDSFVSIASTVSLAPKEDHDELTPQPRQQTPQPLSRAKTKPFPSHSAPTPRQQIPKPTPRTADTIRRQARLQNAKDQQQRLLSQQKSPQKTVRHSAKKEKSKEEIWNAAASQMDKMIQQQYTPDIIVTTEQQYKRWQQAADKEKTWAEAALKANEINSQDEDQVNIKTTREQRLRWQKAAEKAGVKSRQDQALQKHMKRMNPHQSTHGKLPPQGGGRKS